MPARFSTKAGTLQALGSQVATALLLEQVCFTVAEWRADAAATAAMVVRTIPAASLAVRSSALAEDSEGASLAGRYTSVLDVQPTALGDAVARVIASYGQVVDERDEVLVQPMLTGVRLSGVAFSRDPGTGSGYRVVNYIEGADTAAVTAGGGLYKTFVAATVSPPLPPDMARVIALLSELEALFPGTPLDIEFAFAGPEDSLYLLQVRPLVVRAAGLDDQSHQCLLDRIAQKVAEAQQPHPFLHGHSTVFGVMPDWNPAEIIGIRPRPLALSLYRDLVTDAIWAYQRNNYGYRNLRSFPLLVHFAGQPYIDVRLSFNSFIPRDVEGSLADRLVDYYIDRLVASPSLHDKVEFEIVYSCYTLDLPERMQSLAAVGFSTASRTELSDSLRRLTNRVIDQKNGLWREDEAKLAILARRREQILGSGLDPVARIYWLLEDCKRYGTLPFAGLARAGFIAVQMLRSLVAVGVFTDTDYQQFMNGLNTVSSQLSRDLGELDRDNFLCRYGHLRPGTYDILSPRYDEAPAEYLGRQQEPTRTQDAGKFALGLHQIRAISRLLEQHGLSADVVSLFEFLQAGIELREYSKFIFTRSLSDAISLFRDWGAGLGYDADALSYAHIGCVRELYTGADDPRGVIDRAIEEGRARYRETCALWLPPLITSPDDVRAFHVLDCDPNFITQASASGPVVTAADRDRLAGSIVFIPSADPGYDWLFSHPIGGLVTAYGGVNSHMAIRANELGLPAVIGAGESLFKRWSQAQWIRIDCAARRVEVLS